MTTGQTTARDRAIEVIEAVMPADTVSTRDYGTVGIAPEVGDIVDALIAHPNVLRALAGIPDPAVEWGAKWSDGGYCPSTPPRSEEFARQHARMFGTRPIRREVGSWVYADSGEPVFPNQPEESAR